MRCLPTTRPHLGQGWGGALALPDQHGLALSAMREGDGAGLARALRDDILQGVDQVRTALARGEV